VPFSTDHSPYRIIVSSVSLSYFLFDSTKVTNRETLGFTADGTIATPLIHSEVSYCNSLLLNLLRSQLDRFRLVIKFAFRAFSRTA
jgi:hypothetical protein